MTTPITIIASHKASLAKQASEYMASLDNRLDFFSKTSELTLLNEQAGTKNIRISPLLYRLLSLTKALENKTKNIFRADFEGISQKPAGHHGYSVGPYPYVSLEKDTVLNLGGIAKGFIVDQTFAYLKRQGAKNILVEAGGDIRCQSIERPWKIGLVKPLDKNSMFGIIELFSGALVTSGTSERSRVVEHSQTTEFFNTKTSTFYKQTPFMSVSVQGHFASSSEVYAKCLLMGVPLQLSKQYKALGVRSDKKVVLFDKQGNAKTNFQTEPTTIPLFPSIIKI